MYYKIKDNILFRQYDDYGYITDNSMFGYRTFNDDFLYSGEEYVSESGAVMLGVLSKIPQDIDSVLNKLLGIFVDVELDELKQDVIEFYDMFVEAGFLSRGETYEECTDQSIIQDNEISDTDTSLGIVPTECNKRTFGQNDYLRSLHIEIANECNERCVHCYKEVSEQDQKKAEEIEEQLHKIEAALKISTDQYQYKIHEIEKQLQNVEDEKKQYQQQIKQLQEDLNQEKAKSPTSDCSIIIEAAKMDFSSLSKYQHTSLCVVGIEMLHRYADLDLSSGLLTEFTTDVTKPRLYDNRDRLYHKWMDRYPRGFIGLFNWNAIQNRNDPGNDYIETFYEKNYLPVQIIRIISCNTLRELVDQLKAGISQKMAGKKALFVFPQSDNSYYGVCCTESQFTEQGDLIKLKSDIVSLDA